MGETESFIFSNTENGLQSTSHRVPHGVTHRGQKEEKQVHNYQFQIYPLSLEVFLCTLCVSVLSLCLMYSMYTQTEQEEQMCRQATHSKWENITVFSSNSNARETRDHITETLKERVKLDRGYHNVQFQRSCL